MKDERERLRATFNSAAPLYQRARPEYPPALYDALAHLAALRSRDPLLEIGCASGKATIPLARRGFPITCIEIGPALAAEARRNLAAFPDVRVINAPFEEWRPPEEHTFALVFAATAWQWLDPALRYRKAWTLLGPGGRLAFWDATHVFPAGGDPFFHDIQEVYEEIGEGLPPGANHPRPGELPDSRGQIEDSGLFEDVAVRHFDWENSRRTRPRSTSRSSTPSPATSRWRRGNGTASMAKSGAGWPSGRTDGYAGIGGRSCT